MNDPFYIGWQPRGPKGYARFVKWVVIILLLMIPIIGFLLAGNQKDFSEGVYDLDDPSRLTGFVFKEPVPVIRIGLQTKPVTYKTIPLVGYGKFGARSTLEEIEAKYNFNLEDARTTLQGSLIYDDGVAIFELTEQVDAYVDHEAIVYGKRANYTPIPLNRNKIIITGEVIDPKCFFGIMKPGLGKVHKSCAQLCIRGGIPPMLFSEDSIGNRTYRLLLGPGGEPVNRKVLHYVAEPIAITGRLYKWFDWELLYADPQEDYRFLDNHIQ